MDSYSQTSGIFSSSFVESPRTVESRRPTDYCEESSLCAVEDEGILNSENYRGNGIHTSSVDREIMGKGDKQVFTGILDIFVHHARDIHNICIYDKQDVYAKLSLTCSPEEALSTRIVNGGGRNPVFNETLQLKMSNQLDASLKCEMWMLSRARNYLEDQLLGFALVPLSTVAGKGKMTQDFALSSTDLFHSPAGIVRLTLLYHGSLPSDCQGQVMSDSNLALSPSSISSEVVLLDRGVENCEATNYNDIEFPDLQVASENHQMVSEYFKMASNDLKPENSTKRDLMVADPNENEFTGASFLHLGSSPSTEDDYDMSLNTTDEKCANPSITLAKENDFLAHPNQPDAENSSHDIQNSSTTSSSEEQSSHEFVTRKNGLSGESSRFQGIGNPPDTSNFVNGSVSAEHRVKLTSEDSDKEGAASRSEAQTTERGMPETSFTNPLLSVNLEPDQTVVQQQIVDMYMKSMQQFTESLAKMKLPMDIENQGSDGAVKSGSDQKNTQSGKSAGSRVFYGSRAFF
eukprot:Gb_08370 [translate_table: standard]